MFSLRVDYPPTEGLKRNIVLQKLAGDSDDENKPGQKLIPNETSKPRLEKKQSQHSISSKSSRKGPKLPKKVPRKDSSENALPKNLLPAPKNHEKQSANIAENHQATGKRIPQNSEPTVYLCKLARNIDDLDSNFRIMEESQALDQACKKLKTEILTRDVIKKLGELNVNVDSKASEVQEAKKADSGAFKDIFRPMAPSQFESPGQNVFLLRRAEKEDLLEQIRSTTLKEHLAESKRKFMQQNPKVVYFDQVSNHQKMMDLEDISSPDFAKSLVRIEVRPASEVQESLLPRIRTDLQCSELAEHLVSDVLVPEGPRSERTHSRDSNSENATGNDYGNTPSSQSRNSSDDEDSQDFEDPRVKKLYRMMERNHKGSDRSSDQNSDSDQDFDDRRSHGQMSNELEEKPKKYKSRPKAVRNRQTHLTVAQDAWYHHDEGYD